MLTTERRIAITDGRLKAGSGEIGFAAALQRLVSRVAVLVDDGVERVILREKDLAPAEYDAAATQLMEVLRPTATGLLLAGPFEGTLELAARTGAAGIHIAGNQAGWTALVRRRAPGIFLSVSCHSASQVQAAAFAGASAALFAPVFGKSVDGVEVVPPAGLAGLQMACEAADLPVFALGGVDENNARSCITAGAAGIAGIRLFFP